MNVNGPLIPAITLYLLSVIVSYAARAESFTPAQLRTPFLFHVAQFTKFDLASLPVDRVNFCFLENQNFLHANLLQRAIQRKVHDRQLYLVRLNHYKQLEQQKCQLIFVAKQYESAQVFERLKSLHQDTVSVGESINFVDRGGMLTIVPEQTKMKIYFNRQVYENTSLKFSSLFLKHVKFR